MKLSLPLFFPILAVTLTACGSPQEKLPKKIEGRPLSSKEQKRQFRAISSGAIKARLYQQQLLKEREALWGRCEQVGPTLSKLLTLKGLEKKCFSLKGSRGTLKSYLDLISTKTGLKFEVTEKAKQKTQELDLGFISQEIMFIPEMIDALLAQAQGSIECYATKDRIIISSRAESDARPCLFIHDVSDLEQFHKLRRKAESISFQGHTEPTFLNEYRPLSDLTKSYQKHVPKGGSFNYSNGFLLARLPYGQQEKLAQDLYQLRKSCQSRITVQAHFLKVPLGLLRQIRAAQFSPSPFTTTSNKITGLSPLSHPETGSDIESPPLLSSRPNPQWRDCFSVNEDQIQALLEFVQRTQKYTSMNAPRFTLTNGQRFRMSELHRRAYIKDIEVTGTGVIPVINPVIGEVETGPKINLQVKVRSDRETLQLEWESTFTEELPSKEFTKRGSFIVEKPQLQSRSRRLKLLLGAHSTILATDFHDPKDTSNSLPILGTIPFVKKRLRKTRISSDNGLQKIVLLKFSVSSND